MFKEKSMRVAFYCAHKFFFQATSFTTAKKKKDFQQNKEGDVEY